MRMSFAQAFEVYVKAGFPIMLVQTTEVDRASDVIRMLGASYNKAFQQAKSVPPSLERAKLSGYTSMTWDCVTGWHMIDPDRRLKVGVVDKTDVFPHYGLNYLIDSKTKPGFYIMQNAHMFFNDGILPDGTPSLPRLIQLFRSHYEVGKSEGKHLFLVGAGADLPAELRPLTVVLDFPLPSKEELEAFIMDYVYEVLGATDVPKTAVQEAATAASGLTTHEVEAAVCMAVVQSGGKGIDRQLVFDEKVQSVKRSGLLEYMPTTTTINDVGGLDNFKDWLRMMSKAFLQPEKARAYGKQGLPAPRGVLAAGISGVGKSLLAKAAASLFEVPLFRLDIGRLFGSLVGSTEAKTRDLLQLLPAVSPCAVLVDELEKSLAGAGSGAQDTGVSDRLTGALLTFMQEKTVPVFFVFTANDVSRLPMELMRKGRLDNMFFCDLPTEPERMEILRIHLSRHAEKMSRFKGFEELAGTPTMGFTGAEIEAVVIQAMYAAFQEDRPFGLKDVELAIGQTIPLVKTRSEEIKMLRSWAHGKAVMASSGGVVNIDAIPSKPKSTVFWGQQAPSKKKG